MRTGPRVKPVKQGQLENSQEICSNCSNCYSSSPVQRKYRVEIQRLSKRWGMSQASNSEVWSGHLEERNFFQAETKRKKYPFIFNPKTVVLVLTGGLVKVLIERRRTEEPHPFFGSGLGWAGNSISNQGSGDDADRSLDCTLKSICH